MVGSVKPIRALSVRQPYAEAILLGIKSIEYRSIRTNIRERVYIYASKTPCPEDIWEKYKLQPGTLPTGVLVGTSTTQLVEAIQAFISSYNQSPAPFVWRKREVKGSQLRNTIVNLCN